MSLKQPDGSFLVSHNAEVDMRGIYCMLVVATMLDLMTPELIKGLRAFIASCQTYEGGFSAASQPYFSGSPPSLDNLLESPRPALGEAHGGYTFCALASLVLLETLDPNPDPSKWMGINVKRLYRWAVNMQGLPIEGGGFRGRTNKLVDGCYSWWVGGLFPLLEDIIGHSAPSPTNVVPISTSQSSEQPKEDHDQWADDDGSLYNRQALQGFILVSSQTSAGGLRDKPGKPADGYHTLYNLSGLSSAQHHVHRPASRQQELEQKWVAPPSQGLEVESSKEGEGEELRKKAFVASMAWAEDEGASKIVGGKPNRVNATHPTFDLTMTASRTFMNHFYQQKC
ncbi:terpenoid cyclases/Protein prenyltransferase [Clavulina sp. PMI_390]|nr:terpenoid cyclases/Protein prenyltransferase [Clavulina sp. PMI_390]